MKALLGPHIDVTISLCNKGHSSITFVPTLQEVVPPIVPTTVHLKTKESSGQVGGAAMNCPATSPADNEYYIVSVMQIVVSAPDHA